MDMMKTERLYKSQGGPIILSQIENECEPMEYEIGAPGGPFIATSYDYDAPLDESVITNVQAYVFKSKSGAFAAFLANYNPRSYATVALQLASLVYKHSS